MANGRLKARAKRLRIESAAPDLLEALKLAHDHMMLHIPNYRSKSWNMNRLVTEAIKKAEGES